MIKIAISVAAILFILSAVWLYLTFAHENRTTSWKPTSAEVTANGAEVATNRGRGMRGGVKAWATTIVYSVDGESYEAVVDEYLVGSDVTVYVNPGDPREVVGKAGATIQGTFYPILATVFTGLLTVVMALIAFSPKDD